MKAILHEASGVYYQEKVPGSWAALGLVLRLLRRYRAWLERRRANAIQARRVAFQQDFLDAHWQVRKDLLRQFHQTNGTDSFSLARLAGLCPSCKRGPWALGLEKHRCYEMEHPS